VPNSALCAGPSALPPTATAVTNAPAMPSTNAATAIASLAGSDPNPGGSVTRYSISTLPTAASGILYLGVDPVTAGQVITAAEAAGLSFDPATATIRLDLGLLPAGAYQVRVLDAVGRPVLATTGDGGTILSLDLRTVAMATYTVQVRGASGQQFTKRLVKE
jgi:hypothetical protein